MAITTEATVVLVTDKTRSSSMLFFIELHALMPPRRNQKCGDEDRQWLQNLDIFSAMGVHTDAHLQLLHHLSRISDYTNVILMFIHSKLLRQCR